MTFDTTPRPGLQHLPVQVAVEQLDRYRIVDVRQPDEFIGELGHIAGAALAPLDRLADLAAAWDRRATLLVVCRSGGRSTRGAEWLASQGFDVVNLAGGMLAWSAASLPVCRDAGHAPGADTAASCPGAH